MKKEIYEKPLLEIVALLDVDIITESPIESGDEDITSGWSQEFLNTLKDLIFPWAETDESGNLLFDEQGNVIWKTVNEENKDDVAGWMKAQEDYEAAVNEYKNSQGNSEGNSGDEDNLTSEEDLTSNSNGSEEDLLTTVAPPTNEDEANSLIEAIIEEVVDNGEEIDQDTRGFEEPEPSSEETPSEEVTTE